MRASRARFGPLAGERLAHVMRSGRRAHVDRLRIVGAVLCGQHARLGRVRQDLRLIDHEQPDLLETTQRATFTGTEENAAAVTEAYLLLASGKADAMLRVDQIPHLGAQHT